MLNQREPYGEASKDYVRLSGRSETTFARRAELDREYIQRWSLWLDIYIIFQTIKEVLARDGAY